MFAALSSGASSEHHGQMGCMGSEVTGWKGGLSLKRSPLHMSEADKGCAWGLQGTRGVLSSSDTSAKIWERYVEKSGASSQGAWPGALRTHLAGSPEPTRLLFKSRLWEPLFPDWRGI